MNKMMWKTTLREIKQSMGRYLAILAIVALGVGLFSGLKIMKPLIIETANQYLKEKHFYDFQLVSTYGFEQADVEYLAAREEMHSVQGAYTYDVLYQYGDDENTMVMKVHTLTEGINELDVVSGRLPKKAGECVVDSDAYGEESIGKKIYLTDMNEEETLDSFAVTEFTITGTVDASAYIQYERGNTSLGNGKINAFMYVLPISFDSEVYTEVWVKFQEDFVLYSEEYEAFIDKKEAQWEEYVNASADQRFERIQTDAYEELADARDEFETEKADAEAELADAKKKLDDAKAEIADGKAEIADGWRQLENGKAELADGRVELANARQELEDGWMEIESNEKQLDEGYAKLEENKALIESQEQELLDGIAQLDAADAVLVEKTEELLALEEQLSLGLIPEEQRPQMEAALAYGKAEVEAAKQQLLEQRAELEAAQMQLEAGKAEIAASEQEIQLGYEQLEAAKQQLEDGKAELAVAEKEIARGEQELIDAKAELIDAQAKLADGEAEYLDGLVEYEDGLAEFEAEIAYAEVELADAEAKIQDMELPECYVLGRDTNVGYVCLDNDSSIVDDVSDVFPVFFFLIAALVCMTTMNRMIEEQRTQIGILKALGYSRTTIMAKYLFYSGSAAGLGCLLGYFMGTFFLTKIIWMAYGMMYNMDELVYFIDWPLAIVSLLCSMACSMGVTWLSCHVELNEVAASLMRPKAPKAGKRVFLEHLPFIWKRLSFLVKVSIRNVFRYKKRFFMMIVGISGSMALLVTGFGIQDSISDVVTMQYEEIQKYHISASFRDALDEDMLKELDGVLEGRVTESALFMEGALDLKYGGHTKSVSMVVPKDAKTFNQYVDLHTLDGNAIAYPQQGEVVVSHKICKDYEIEIGDFILLMDEDHNQFEVKVSGICQNFVSNYVFIHPDTCKSLWKEPEYKTVYINVPQVDDSIHSLSADLMAMDDVANVVVNEDVKERFETMMSTMDYLVAVIIFCAAALAFIVLYNLTNINITERIREIATIKVLGFYKNETASYVFRENIALTAVGSFVGLFLGKLFHAFVMSCVNIDMIAFDVRIKPISYVYSLLLTMVFAWLVNKFMSGKLDKISMTESLKSVD